MLGVITLAGCAGDQPTSTKADDAACVGNEPAPAAAVSASGTPAAKAAAGLAGDLPGLHNLHAAPGAGETGATVYSGSQPDGDAGFESLAQLGVKTIISVDGGRPDVERAHARGMRYVHVPVTYGTITPEQQRALARAVRDRAGAGPIYIHCHHGKHRGPAAAAAACLALGWTDPATATRFLKDAGTSPKYPGLYAVAAEGGKMSDAQLALAPANPPEVAETRDFVAGMVAIDAAFEHLGLIEKAGWRTPADHPDLVPAAEAEIVVETFRALAGQERARAAGNEKVRAALQTNYFAWLDESFARAEAVRDGLTASTPDPAALSGAFKALGTACNDCHAAYRN